MIIEDFQGPEALVKELGSDYKTGILGTAVDKLERQRAFGQNSFPPPKIKTICELIAENFDDAINKILFGASIVSMIIGIINEGFPEGMIEGTSILIALLIIIVVNSGNNYISERRLADLVNLSEKQEVTVFRNSTEATTIDGAELLVGDIIKFEAGQKVPADCIMIEGQDVSCIEGELTGEPDAIEKTPLTEENYNDGRMCTMIAKSLVATGFGKALVLAVGPNTVAGVITTKTQQAPQPTLLQEKLETIANKIGNVGIFVACLTMAAQVIKITLEYTKVLPCGCANILTCEELDGCTPLSFSFDSEVEGVENDFRLYRSLLESVIIAITVVVVAIPEGLPLAVTISLSFSSAKMRKLNNLVRKLASSETMGSATHICSDKTGTLTLNKMTVMACMTLQKAQLAGNVPSDKFPNQVKDVADGVEVNGDSVWKLLTQGVMWNSSARIEKNDGSDPAVVEPYLTKGNVTEQGLIKFFMGVFGGEGCIDLKNQLTEDNTLLVISFTSSRKRASIVVRDPSQEGTDKEVRVYCKGAPDMLFDLTTGVVCADGSVQSVDDQTLVSEELLNSEESGEVYDTHRNIFERTVKKFAKQAYRTLLITYKDMSMADYEQLKAENNDFEKESDRTVLENGLIAIGIFGLQDPLRGTIVSSINRCKAAGIQVIMCTGDNIDTAIAISKNAGIVTEEQVEASKYSCMTGKDFREAVGGIKQIENPDKPGEMKDVVSNMKKFREVKQYLRVLARSSPEDKYLLVTGIQDSDGVVAVTGDGTNDAPALTKADVGFSMGITGTDVAKGASDIILLDDNFSSIVVALKYGRNVFDNVRKFLQFQLTVNVVAMFIVFLGSVILKDSPLTAVQMLWVNLIMDTFAALALATEPPPESILDRQPYKKNAAIVTEVMWRNVFGHAIYQAIVILFIIFFGQVLFTERYENTCSVYADEEMTTCSKYNPFYTTELYFNNDAKKHWSSPKFASLTKADFDEDELLRFSCFEQMQKDEKYNCTTQLTSVDSEDVVLPKDAAFRSYTQKLIHYTYVFQCFVFMQVFNQINARKLEEHEKNVFAGFFNNMLFIYITIFTILIQMFMVEYGGDFVQTYPLSAEQNLHCILIGLLELLNGLVLKFIPLRFFQCVSLDENPQAQNTQTMVSALKKSSTMRRTTKNDDKFQKI
mmetsp:Transcript_15972/g.26934  ORF Transcript_15972/g.26934 Transcript_15972/m.26934 type:complete len:1163 (-) Transcript_15972:42-3530(-)|eukprot:CAMPEP_0168612440 /NCGR_PEP_ID=MMETSP0449_2-20121227/2920_1 /TAXON_ID=1082188 /ORGANISM="Strombidium rassoulzadegani, Strain ras09" /LENGTH=1162 /DNA_ID=CAMNT_0008653009 /DNA_START=99 /DNA_END=3587 /DNA_ORIENTATION=-